MARQLTARFAMAMLASAMVLVTFCWVAPSAEAASPTCTKVNEPYAPSGNGYEYLRVPASSKYSYDCQLANGNANGAVKVLQQALNYCYGKGLSVDSKFGAKTESALKAAQKTEKISSDGVYGPQTSSYLKFMSISDLTGAAKCGGRR